MLIERWNNPCGDGGKRLDFGHLGGTATTGDPDSWYPEMWAWLVEHCGIHSVLDVGCGCGFGQRFFSEMGLSTFGIDCEEVLKHHLDKTNTIAHDLTNSSWTNTLEFDLVWCCEVAEHIDERFVNNVVETLVFNTGRVLAFSAALPGAGGYHHVNCQPTEYWVDKLVKAGLTFREDLTEHAKTLCTANYGRSDKNYFKRSGLIFTR